MRYFSLLGLLFLTGCGFLLQEHQLNNEPDGQYLEFDQYYSGLTLDVTATPTGYGCISIVLTVTNEQDEPITVAFENGCIYGFSVWNLYGELVAPAPPRCTLAGSAVTYYPGEVIEHRFAWKWGEDNIPDGTYEIEAGFGPRGSLESSAPVLIELRFLSSGRKSTLKQD